MPPMPLAGRTVVEFSQFIAGPTAAQLLADFGARVVKIEPKGGDGTRALPGTAHGSIYFRCFNTGKDSHVLNMRQDEDRAAFDNLLRDADAMMCNLAPRGLRRMGLGPDTILERFPHLVATYISGFGQDDDRTCMDTIAQCESGFAWMNGDPDGTPRVSTSWPVDFYSGHYAALSTAMAMLDPARNGGAVIDVTMMEVASAVMLGPAALLASEGGEIGAPSGNRDRAASPAGIYPCADGHVYIYGGMDPFWARLRLAVGGPEATFAERMADPARFDTLVSEWTRAQSTDAVLDAVAEMSIPAGRVRHPVEALEVIRNLRQGAGVAPQPDGQMVPAFPALFDGHRIDRRPAPELGGTAAKEKDQ